MKKWLILAVLLGLGWFGYQNRDKFRAVTGAVAVEATTVRQTTATVKLRDLNLAIMAAGDIGPADQVSVRPEINGRIDLLPVDVGDRVKKDQLLVQMDDKDLQTEKSSRLVDIDRARLQAVRAERLFTRSKELYSGKLISQEVFEDTKTEYDLAKNAVERAEKDMRILEDKLTKTKILAPFDCTVLTRPVSIGQAVSGSGGFNSGTEVLSIANLNDMVVNAHINQADITRVNIEQKVEVVVESVAGLKVNGVVERIAPQSTIKNGIKGYAVRIALKDLDGRVLPGMTANVTIPVKSSANAIAVPLAAIFTEGGDHFAYVKKGGAYERRTVEIGISDFDFVEVLNGLTPGEVVSLETPAGEAPNSTIHTLAGEATKPMGSPAKSPADKDKKPEDKPAPAPSTNKPKEVATKGSAARE